ncbi:hypothetical protein RR48_04407 [Papilio machaon]|uniref:Uncharacterized protein n=1 Tax=Papilio machaon TaxID=76193 RepID=A0A0N1IE11_PAPMA|nr:hypothetical protein RR48_04407 [Papilio machaon]
MNIVTIISRTTRKRINQYNEAYIIMVDNFDIFNDKFKYLTKEKDWNPNVYFLIVFKEINTKLLNDLFNILLNYHILEVVVINSKEIQLFTYNPFDNYNCGKSFTSIIKLDDCAAVNITSLYFYKFHTGLKRCTFNAVVPHWPPYVINPERNVGPVKLLGTEQYIMKILSQLEGFNINYTYTDNAEEFSVIDNDMKATGSLSLIQNKKTDMIFGGMLLTYERGAAFSYFCGHHPFIDKLDIMVKKTGPLPIWRNLYLEFTYVVWILLAFTFFIFFVIFVSFCIKEKCRIFLIMWAILLQQSCRLHYKFKVKCFIFQWILFSCLVNIYYQSNLMGLTTHVSHNYQISNEKDLLEFKLQSCVSHVIKEVVRITTGKEYESGKYCDTFLNSLDTVSEDDTKYTVTLYSIYNYNKFKYTDDYGDPLLYPFKIPIYKVMYAVYFYKGFPMLNILHTHTLRLRENGLIKYKMDELDYENSRKTFFAKKQFQARFIFPGCVLMIGLGLAVTSFIIELLVDYVQRKRMNNVIFIH